MQRKAKFILTTSIATFGVAIAALTYSELPSKSLSVYVGSSVPLLSRSSGQASQELSITYQGAHLTAPHQLRVVVSNNGNLPIHPGDVETPLVVHFDGSQVITTDDSKRAPDDLNAQCSRLDTDKVVFTHGLLNPSDRLVCNLIIDGAPAKFKATGRIAGISRMRITKEESPEPMFLWGIPWYLMLTGVSGATLLALMLSCMMWVDDETKKVQAWAVGASIYFVSIFAILLYVWSL